MKKVVALSMALLTLTGISSCETSPGVAEPSTFICLYEGDQFSCVHTYDNNARKFLPPVEGIGYQCIHPDGYADIKTHHEILHRELNNCKNKLKKK